MFIFRSLTGERKVKDMLSRHIADRYCALYFPNGKTVLSDFRYVKLIYK